MHKKRTDVPNKRSTLYAVFDKLKVYKFTLNDIIIAYRAILCNLYNLSIILDVKVYNSNKSYKNKEISKKVLAILCRYAIIRYKQMRDIKGGQQQ